MKSRYGFHVPAADNSLALVGPGEPMGELMRRYWQPLCLSDELPHGLVSLPRRVRILCEDLVVFRAPSGQVGCLELHCAHRGASLEYGQIEAGGIRCCYHGWLFDTQGQCTDMPAEEPGMTAKMDVWQPAYPVHEFGGLVFVYMGPPELQPLFPMYDIIDVAGRDDVVLRGMRLWEDHSVGFVRDCNWLQAFENLVDAYHLVQLHAATSGDQFGSSVTAPGAPEINFEETPLGVRYHMARDLPNGNRLERFGEACLPNIMLIPSIHEPGDTPKSEERATEMSFCVPVDNETICALTIVAWPAKDGVPIEDWKPGIDTITDIRPGNLRSRPYEDKQRRPDDMEAQESQRRIAVHGLEHLGRSDVGVAMLRQQFRDALKAMQRGEDPPNIQRDPAANKAIPTHAWNTVVAGGAGAKAAE
jgi:phenylpropionate dioxygenase-like ring-hydroxylating dioxygenase large terminal subunit